MKTTNQIVQRIFYGEGDPEPTPTAITPEIQKIIDAKVKEATERIKAEDTKTLEELETYKQKLDKESKERKAVEDQIQIIRTRHKTAEDLAKEEQGRIKKTYEEQISAIDAEKNTWKTRFETSQIETSIVSAASTNKAVNPKQLLAILKPVTKLVPVIDDTGKETGQFQTLTRITSGDKELELPTDQAIAKLREDKSFFNLFGDTMKSGFGGEPNAKSVDIVELAKDPAAYRAARKAGTV